MLPVPRYLYVPLWDPAVIRVNHFTRDDVRDVLRKTAAAVTSCVYVWREVWRILQGQQLPRL
jgi:hypothetical protein